ncbi:MAG TPA: hypothetical protein P5186_20385 [Candidatus Paceibacterota bacterium]|nr:hypothetical protein [Verrucomicrobiota bacterium]HRY50417.1 hypothetical protein [Candidatus Paceibacterota bacterium]HRZ99510.1 hypothetical protein [Candidatus Paceibacterota bacterium]
MNPSEIILLLLAVAAIGVDILVRLVIAPHRRDQLLTEMLDNLIEPDLVSAPAVLGPEVTHSLDQLGGNLLRYFEQAAVSRNILETLAVCENGLSEKAVLAAVNHQLEERRKRALPESVVRKVVMILMGAEFVVLKEGSLRITEAGRMLHTALRARRNEIRP